jgi:SAM-dependent methyltransferase
MPPVSTNQPSTPNLGMAPLFPACPLCQTRELEIFSDGVDVKLDPLGLGSSRQHISHGRILRCRACEFGFRQMRPSEVDLFALYSKLDSSVYEKEAIGRSQTAKRHLQIVEHYAAKGYILDVGCASGIFLRKAAETGWMVVGVEPANGLCQQAKQLLHGHGEIHCGSLQEVDLPQSFFDAITLWDVLEHVPDPVLFLNRCASLLKPGGYLFLNVPDLDSVQARLLKDRWPLLLAEHLNYFNRPSLRRCGELAGLRWVAFGQRAAWFSLEYVLYRLGQHEIPGASYGRRVVANTLLGRICLPILLGESYGVWSR